MVFMVPKSIVNGYVKAGFQEVRVELIPKDAIHKDRSAFEGWIRTTWLPYTQRLPEEKRDAFIAQIADEYLQQYSVDENGSVHVHMMRLEVRSRETINSFSITNTKKIMATFI